MSPGAVGLLMCVPILLALYAFLYFRNRNGEWHTAGFKDQMCRFVDGKWQYREMTDDELKDQWQARQW